MSITTCKHFIDAQSKVEITVLIDCFGSTYQVQTPMLTGDHAVDVGAATATMSANESGFIAKLKARGFTDDQIDALKKNPNDCGCGGAS